MSTTLQQQPAVSARRALHAAPVLLAALLAGACRSAGDAPMASDPGVADAAAAVMAEARTAEPELTARIVLLAEQHGGRAAGLEHRLKTRESTEEEIERLMLEAPGTSAGDVVLYDALRYTIVVGDEPPGSHVRAVRAILYALEEDGNTVRSVKNYWLRGDSYSGVNTVITAPGGLFWELQLHTPTSFETKSSTHASYERMRSYDTPLAEQRRIFDESTELWDTVPVPLHILDGPGKLHPAEEIRLLPAPAADAAQLAGPLPRAAA